VHATQQDDDRFAGPLTNAKSAGVTCDRWRREAWNVRKDDLVMDSHIAASFAQTRTKTDQGSRLKPLPTLLQELRGSFGEVGVIHWCIRRSAAVYEGRADRASCAGRENPINCINGRCNATRPHCRRDRSRESGNEV
jgi:hypothetical protein